MTTPSKTLSDSDLSWCMAASFAAHATSEIISGIRRYHHRDDTEVRTCTPSCARDLYHWNTLADQGLVPSSEQLTAYERPDFNALPEHANLPAIDLQFLYRHYDRDGRLLYIGITNDPANRRGQHAMTSLWWCEYDPSKTTYEYWPSRASVEKREQTTIGLERPLHNKDYNRR